MKDFEVVEGFALLFWSFQLAPQVYTNAQRASTDGLSSSLLLLWTVASLCTGLYCIGSQYPVLFIVQPNVFIFFSILCWAQCYYYKNARVGIIAAAVLSIIIVAVESVGGILLLQLQQRHSWIYTLLGSASTALFGVGFIPQFSQIVKEKRVQGISRAFLCIDMTGSVLSVVALILQGSFDPAAAACYIIVFVCDFAILILSFILCST